MRLKVLRHETQSGEDHEKQQPVSFFREVLNGKGTGWTGKIQDTGGRLENNSTALECSTRLRVRNNLSVWVLFGKNLLDSFLLKLLQYQLN